MKSFLIVLVAVSIFVAVQSASVNDGLREEKIPNLSSREDRERRVNSLIKTKSNEDMQLECHYSFSHLFRWPVYITIYKIKCNQKADSFEFVDDISKTVGSNASISIDRKSGDITITPGNPAIEVKKTVQVRAGDKTYVFEIRIDAANNVDTPGINYNYTTYLQHVCHRPWVTPNEPRKGNTFTPTFHGYKDLGEFGDLFPGLLYIPYTQYYRWNMTIDQEDDYNFYVSTYDTAELYIDGVKLISGFHICSTAVANLNATIHLKKGVHSFLAFVESYSESKHAAYFLVYYGKTSDPLNRYPLPAIYYDNIYDPLLDLSTDQSDFMFLKGAKVTISLHIKTGYRLNCSSDKPLPKGLGFNWDYVYIEGIPEEAQEKTDYQISCRNIQSVTNVIVISIEIRGDTRPGLIATYTKPKNKFDNYCFTIYDPDSEDNTDVYVRRHEADVKQTVTVDGRFPDLPIDFTSEYSVVYKGYIIIKKSGSYKLIHKNSDSFSCDIGYDFGSYMLICRDVTVFIENREIQAGVYPFSYGYTNNFYQPYVEFELLLNDTKADYEFVYTPEEEIEYNYTATTYHFNETIMPNRILNPPKDIKKVTVTPDLPDGLAINETTGEITGIPLIENMDLTKYTITIETDSSKYITFVEIRLKNYIVPGGFYIHDLLTGKDYKDEPPKFKKGTKVDFEVYNVEGVVTQYIVMNSVPGLASDTKNGHLRMRGITQSTYNYIDFNFKATDGKHSKTGEIVIPLESLCKENEQVHIFTYISTYEESSIKLIMTSVNGNSSNEIVLTSLQNETFLCLIPGEYKFHIDNVVYEFKLNVTADGKGVVSKNYQPYKSYDDIFSTKYHKPSLQYNNGKLLNLKLYERFTLYPEVTGCMYSFSKPYHLPDTVNFDLETGKLWGYYSQLTDENMIIYAKSCEGLSVTAKFPVKVSKDSFLSCQGQGKISYEIIYHIDNEDVKKHMSLSLSGSEGKEIYSANMYKNTIKDRTDVICLTDDDYLLHLYDRSEKLEGWKNGYITVKINNFVYGEYTVEESVHLKNIPFHLHPFLHSKIQWSYSYHYLENYWKFDTKDDWKTSLFNEIPKTTTNTTYIRYSFDVNKDLPYVSTLISFNYLSGIIVYVNEQQVYKANMDYDKYDENTPASDYNDVIANIKYLIPLDLMTTEKTLIAVELHKHDSETKYPHFNLTIDLLDDHEGCNSLADYSGFVKNYYPKDMSLYDTDVRNVFLNNNKYWATALPNDFESGNDNVLIEYNFGENNYFYPNVLYVESYAEDDNYKVNANPKSINVQGRDSTTASTTNLIKVDDLNLKEKKSYKYVRFYGNSNGFNTIRLNISAVNNATGDNDQMNINKLHLLSCRNTVCKALGDLPETAGGEIISVPCKNEAKNSKVFECMNGVNPRWKEIENYCEEEPIILNEIDNIILTKSEYNSESIGEFSGMNLVYSSEPELPKCLSLQDGMIKGKCDEVMDKTEYNIKIKNDYGEVTMKISITVKESNYPVILMKDNSVSINSGVIYNNEKIFDITGNGLSYEIHPLLPVGMELTSDGLLNGILEGEINNVEYLLTVKNEYRTLYYPINITATFPEKPNVLSVVNKITLHYGINYKKLSVYDVYGKDLTYSNTTLLPGNLELDKKTGILTGEIESKNNYNNRNEKMIIRAETPNDHSDINIDYLIEVSNIPIVIGAAGTLDINIGEDVFKYTGIVLGNDLVYSISYLPKGLEMDAKTGLIKGKTFDTSDTPTQCRINVANPNGYVYYDMKLDMILPNKPIITEIHKENVFVPGVEIKPFTLVKAVGENITYEIEPQLPNGMKFISLNGIVYGKVKEISNTTNYKLIIKSSGESTTEDIIIKIEEIFCEAEGKWPKTLVGQIAEIPCDEKGTERRECLLIDGKGVWGDIDSNCSSVSYATLAALLGVASVAIIGMIGMAIYKYVKKTKTNKNEEAVNLEKPLL